MGVVHFSHAEDIVQETLITALNSWRDKGIPENPSAWLFRVARNKSINYIVRENKRSEIHEKATHYLSQPQNDSLPEHEIHDSMLRMIFACCSPGLQFENQILIILNTLGGFSRREIARALLLEEETVKKRLYRVKKDIRKRKLTFEVPQGNLRQPRLNAVLNTLYLLFNEGYNSSNHETLIRKDICLEAMRLTLLIINHFPEDTSGKALFALMCFHAARFESRLDDQGAIVLFQDQDRSCWNQELIHSGISFLAEASQGPEASTYHLEANIAAEHCTAPDFEQTDWYKINRLYHWLYIHKPSPVIQLNIAIVSSKIKGPEYAIEQLKYLLTTHPDISRYYLLHATMGYFYQQVKNNEQAIFHLEKARSLTHSEKEKQLLMERLHRLKSD